MHEPDSGRPRVRILHQLGRSGGTLIAKCLAVMEDTVLLSEVHPDNKEMVKIRGRDVLRYFPLVQGYRWFNLIAKEEIDAFERRGYPPSFAAEIVLIHERCTARRKALVLRDFNNLDFTGIHFLAEPPFRFSTLEALQENFSMLRVFTVRHPADQWISLSNLFTADITARLDRFLHGFRVFAEQAVKTGFVRYEDFTRRPETELKRLCQALDLPYDPTWRDRWAGYRKITGDTRARAGKSEITPSRRHPIDPALRRRLEENADYRTSLDLLGYQGTHP